MAGYFFPVCTKSSEDIADYSCHSGSLSEDFRQARCPWDLNLYFALGPRDPMNQNTHFIDMSQVYGPSADENKALRANERGGLRINTSPLAIDFRMMLLPADKDTQDCQRLDESRACFKAGDNRVNIQTALTALHTVLIFSPFFVCNNRIQMRLDSNSTNR